MKGLRKALVPVASVQSVAPRFGSNKLTSGDGAPCLRGEGGGGDLNLG